MHFPHSCLIFSYKKVPPTWKLRRESATDAEIHEQRRQTDGLINREILGFWVDNHFSPTWNALHNSINQFLEASILDIPAIRPGPSPAGGPVVTGPPFEIGSPPFHVWPLIATYIQHCILKMWPPFWFLAPLLLNPGGGPAYVPVLCVADFDHYHS